MDLSAVERLLDALPPYDPAGELALQTRLRSEGCAPELVSAALAQSALRARAREKFGASAAELLFTADGVEQATRPEVATHHADRYRQAGVTVVHDLGCGIGADATAFAAAGLAVRAVDADETTAAVAAANLRRWPAAHVAHRRAEEVRLPSGAAASHTGVWLDPSRRLDGPATRDGRSRRVFSLDRISPSWPQVLAYAAQVPATGAKLGPAFPHAARPPGSEAQWVSWRGEVVECAVWWGPLASTPGRTVLVLRPGREPVRLTEADAAGAPAPLGSATGLGAYLYEPDRAVIRAGLTGALARQVGGAELDPGVGYVSSDMTADVSWASRYAVVEALPWNVKAVRAWLRSRGVGRLTVKKRGVRVDPDAARRELRLSGRAEATLVLTRVGGQAYALVVENSPR